MNARARAVAEMDASIDASKQRAIAAREVESRPRTALEAMAQRLNVSPKSLQTTLQNTVFSGCRTNEEFIALVLVANEYRLNPLLKEIYAFPSKGGGITPMVSVDGWIRMMNEHPEFDGIEFEYHNDENGDTEAIESIIYHKGRKHPIKTIEYMDECKGNTGPWTKSPRRMLRHRALIQGARIAFGFSGIVGEGDEVIEAEYTLSATPSLPPRQSLGEEIGDEIPNFDRDSREERHDPETGEVERRNERGMTEVSEEEARALDAGEDPNDGTLSDDNPTAEEGPAQEQRGEPEDQAEAAAQTLKDIDGPLEAEEPTMAEKAIKAAVDGARAAKTMAELKKIETTWLNARAAVDEDQAKGVDSLIDAARRELRAKADKAGGD